MTSTSTVNKDASEAGSHCHTCGALDFLPFTCLLCRATFCKDHSSQAKRPEDHDCPQAATAPAGPAVAREYSGNEVKFRDLLPDRSSPVVQVTPAQLEKDQKRQAALALLHKNFPGTSTSSTSAKSNTARASGATVGPAQKKILLMKLRQRGKPGDRRRNEGQVPMKERRYFVAVDDATGKTADLWLPQDTSCGKALDLIAEALGVTNRNNLASTKEADRIHLARRTASEVSILDNTKLLGASIEDADEVLVRRGPM